MNANSIHNSVWNANHKEVEQAILIIKELLLEFLKELAFSNKRIYLHNNPKILNFTSIETIGTGYAAEAIEMCTIGSVLH